VLLSVMNFFGHAVLARRREAARGEVRATFVLGAMLPDFASMLRARPPRTTYEPLSEGVRFHHATDDAFHGSETFLEFSHGGASFLLSRGLRKGSARAVAHVAIELLLDSALAREKSANEAYLSALDLALTASLAGHIQWQKAADETRFPSLCRNLRSRGALPTDASPDLVAERLRAILAGRPRLALDDAGQSVVRDWLATVRPMVVSRAARLVSEVEQRLGFEK
jgi:hypothetical protein